MNSNSKTALEINPNSPPVGSVIFLHGLGASGDDFISFSPELEKLTNLPLRFILPTAEDIPVTVNNGYQMPAWYDIFSLDKDAEIDQVGIEKSLRQVAALIEKEKAKGMPAEKIIVGGFSQGAVIALNTLVSYPQRLAGIIALSGYLTASAEQGQAANRRTPVFLGHGISDEMVPCAAGEQAYTSLKAANYPATWHAYRMGHSVCRAELVDLAGWLKPIFV